MYVPPYDQENMYNSSRNNFATAAMVLSVVAVFSCTSVYLSIILCPLAVIFAFLSRKGTGSLPSLSKIAIIISVIAFVIAVVLLISAIKTLPTILQDPTYRNEIESIMKNLYGSDFSLDEYLGTMSPNYL